MPMLISRLLINVILLLCASTVIAENRLSDFINNTLDAPDTFLPVNKAFNVNGEHSTNQTLSLNWTITPGYYLYKSRFEFSSQEVTLDTPRFPSAIVIDDPYIGKTEIYKQDFSIHIPVKKMGASQATALIHITFQGCAEAGYCYPPETIDIDVPINHSDTNQIQSSNVPAKISDTPPQHTAIIYLLFAFMGGLILNLMPCVFPILSIKVLGFKSHADSPAHLKIHGWVYTAGVVLSFMLIAAILLYLRAAGAAIGWGFQLQNPPFIVALIVLFFMMGLNLFGFFEIDAALDDNKQSLMQGHQLKAAFFTGLLSVIVATPCTVPFMAPAVGFALTQSPAISLMVFASLGFGLAMPFLVLAHYPSLLRWLPKPGAWMQHLKQFLAFPLFLTAIWLLWVLGHQTTINYVAAAIIVCAVLTFAVWLWQLHYKKTMVGLLIVASIAAHYGMRHTISIEENFTQPRFDELRLAGEPVLINMTADWCITCLINERVALSTSAVKEAIQQAGIHYLKGDWTNQNPEITAFLRRFGRSGVPLYVYYPAGVTSTPVVLPQLLTPSTVIDVINPKVTP